MGGLEPQRGGSQKSISVNFCAGSCFYFCEEGGGGHSFKFDSF